MASEDATQFRAMVDCCNFLVSDRPDLLSPPVRRPDPCDATCESRVVRISDVLERRVLCTWYSVSLSERLTESSMLCGLRVGPGAGTHGIPRPEEFCS